MHSDRRASSNRSSFKRVLLVGFVSLSLIFAGLIGSNLWGVSPRPRSREYYYSSQGLGNELHANWLQALWSFDPELTRNNFWAWYGRVACVVLVLGFVALTIGAIRSTWRNRRSAR